MSVRSKVLIFAGSSINHEDAAEILDATYWPPISRGDIGKAASEGYEIIGIIDGIFFSRAAAAHKEIINVIKSGVIVIGGCSMGALRASELDIHGMEGVGTIYGWYRDGVIEDDDEVAVATNPDTFESVSSPMVNIRETLKAANSAGIIDNEQCELITQLAKKHITQKEVILEYQEQQKKRESYLKKRLKASLSSAKRTNVTSKEKMPSLFLKK